MGEAVHLLTRLMLCFGLIGLAPGGLQSPYVCVCWRGLCSEKGRHVARTERQNNCFFQNAFGEEKMLLKVITKAGSLRDTVLAVSFRLRAQVKI